MARGKIVRPEVEEKVRFLLLGNEKLMGKELKSLMEEKNPDIEYTVRTYQTLKRRAIPALSSLKDLDMNWHIGLLKQSPLPSNVVFNILRLMQKYGTLTKREVLWVSRFHEVVKGDDTLRLAVTCYSLWEIYCALTGKEFNTTELDKELIKGNLKSLYQKWIQSPQTKGFFEASMFQSRGLGKGEDYLKSYREDDKQ